MRDIGTVGPTNAGFRESASPIKPFLLGLLIGGATVVMLGLTLPTKVSPSDYAQSAFAKIFPPPDNAEFLVENALKPGVKQTKSGLQYKVIKPGEGASPTATDTALVNYEGTLRDGTVFDANEQTPMPVNGVVPGFSEALQLMQKGGEYRIWIPSELAYGEASPGPELPANSLLIFDVTLMDFISAEQMQALQQQAIQQQGGRAGGAPRPAPPGQ